MLLFFWAWPQPNFDTENLLSIGEAQHAKEIIAQKRWQSARALVGLGLLGTGYAVQFTLIFVGVTTRKGEEVSL